MQCLCHLLSDSPRIFGIQSDSKVYFLLTVHIRIILVSDQLNAEFFSIICFFESSTFFEQLCAHLQEDKCITTISGIITLC